MLRYATHPVTGKFNTTTVAAEAGSVSDLLRSNIDCTLVLW